MEAEKWIEGPRMSLLKIRNLKMYYETKGGLLRAVDNVSFDLDRGETLGIVGESGCGKSSLAFTMMRVLPPNSKILGGQIFFSDKDLLKLTEKEMRQIRWTQISMIFQSAMNALNPVFKVGDMAIETLMTHELISRSEAKIRVGHLYELMGLEKSRINNYPHEFSGGMKQRAVIAMSLVCNPKMVIADEPTTALDVVVQEQILQRIKELQKKMGMAMLLISHDISIVTETCEKIAVMYGGRIVELGRTVEVFKNPRHPYTTLLMQSFPSIRGEIRKLRSIPGRPPNLINPPRGCRFNPRCWLRKEQCERQRYKLKRVGDEHYSSCPLAPDRNPIEVYGELRR